MTPIFLLESVADFIEEKTADILLNVRTRHDAESKKRKAEVFRMNLPDASDRTSRVPYILVQLINGKDEHQPGQIEESIHTIRIVCVTYSEDAQAGSYDVLNLILRLRHELETAGVVNGEYCLEYPVEYIIYPDNTPPYFIGEMVTNWSIPAIERKEREILWQ